MRIKRATREQPVRNCTGSAHVAIQNRIFHLGVAGERNHQINVNTPRCSTPHDTPHLPLIARLTPLAAYDRLWFLADWTWLNNRSNYRVKELTGVSFSSRFILDYEATLVTFHINFLFLLIIISPYTHTCIL